MTHAENSEATFVDKIARMALAGENHFEPDPDDDQALVANLIVEARRIQAARSQT